MPGLDGKTVVLTGTSQGIGVVIAHALAREGAQLVLAARSGDKLTSVARQLTGRVLSVPCDITVASARQTLVQRVLENFGRVDILVNNAGVEEIREYVQ
jgi:NADP-dependent 3-hydroxy acid dehydrogenase YdfG